MAPTNSKPSARVYVRRRRALLRAAARQAKIDAMLVTHPVDVGYLTGFSGEDSFALLIGSRAVLVTDGRFSEQAAKECPGLDIHVRRGSLARAVADVLAGRGIRRIGVQSEHVTLALHGSLAEVLGGKKMVELSGLLSGLRQTKDETEIRAIRRAIRIGEEAFLRMTAGGAKHFVGRTERELAAELEHRMRDLGADAPAFETIVAAGENSSRPHHRPTARRVKPGDAVLLDWGARAGGYCGDLTRVVFTGTIPPRLAEMYQTVQDAQQAARKILRAGAACQAADRAARGVLEAAGFGEGILHGLGHGLGREVHEAPSLTKTSRQRLRVGMVVTVEPGLYQPGLGGVRLEDDVRITARGAERLSRLPRERDAMRLR